MLIQEQLIAFYDTNSESIPIEWLHCSVANFLGSPSVEQYLSSGGNEVPSINSPEFSKTLPRYTIGDALQSENTVVYKAGSFYQVPKVHALSLGALI